MSLISKEQGSSLEGLITILIIPPYSKLFFNLSSAIKNKILDLILTYCQAYSMQIYNLKMNQKIFGFIDLAAKSEKSIYSKEKIHQSKIKLLIFKIIVYNLIAKTANMTESDSFLSKNEMEESFYYKYIEYNLKITQRLKEQYERISNEKESVINSDIKEKNTIIIPQVEENEKKSSNYNKKHNDINLEINNNSLKSVLKLNEEKKSNFVENNNFEKFDKYDKFKQVSHNEYVTKDNVYVKLHNQDVYEEISNPTRKDEKIYIKLHNKNLFEKTQTHDQVQVNNDKKLAEIESDIKNDNKISDSNNMKELEDVENQEDIFNYNNVNYNIDMSESRLNNNISYKDEKVPVSKSTKNNFKNVHVMEAAYSDNDSISIPDIN